MKKVMLFTLSVMMMANVSVFAQSVVKSAKDSTSTTVTTTTKAEPVKTAIKTAELPKPVTDLIATFKAQGWDAAESSSSVKQGTVEIAFYEVTFKKVTTGETKSIYIDAQGKIVKQ